MGRPSQDYAASPILTHVLYSLLATEETSLEVDVHDMVERLLVTGIKRRDRRNAGIIDLAIYTAVFVKGAVHQPLAIRNLFKIRMNKQSL